ncbi:MAG: hypothetical protein IT395_07090 [Candidatus Omnitrophica bacterium]|jgi:F0F1-type ATP synthase membrane subunit c/vacuolar-type H+-ATPase subunit K|nr:hypothetical protein [Candidatus Omnitrophota bacterium]
MASTALFFILIFYILMLIPCLGVGWIGYKLITRLGRYPSKTPAIQVGIMLKLIIVEVVSLTLILLMFKILVAE